MWKPTNVKNLWIHGGNLHQSRHYSQFLSLQLKARYEHHKLPRLEALNSELDVLRYQTRLLMDFELVSVERYEYISGLINSIGGDLGGWIKQQKQRDNQGHGSRGSAAYASSLS
jgi:hypothetical protein